MQDFTYEVNCLFVPYTNTGTPTIIRTFSRQEYITHVDSINSSRSSDVNMDQQTMLLWFI